MRFKDSQNLVMNARNRLPTPATKRAPRGKQPSNGAEWQEAFQRLLTVEHELEDSRERYAALFDSAPVGHATLNRNGCIQTINLTGAKILGLPREQLKGRPLLPLVARRDRRKFLDCLSALRRQPATASSELHFKRPDGSQPLLQIVSKSTLADERHRDFIHVVLLDVTAQRRTEVELNQSRAILASIVASAMDAIITVDAALQIVHCNAAAEAMFRYRASGIIGQPLSRLLADQLRLVLTGQVSRFARVGVGQRVGILGEIQGRRADGEEFPIEASISRVAVDGQKLLTIILRDISRRKRAEVALQRANERLELAHNAAKVGTFEWDLRGNFMDCSRSTEELYGVPPDTFQGPYENWLRIVHPEDTRRVKAEVRKSLKHADHFELEYRIRRPDTKVRWIQSRCQVFRNPQGRPVRMVGINIDITPRKQLEEVERQAHETLERRVRERTSQLSAANAALQREVAERRRLQQQLLEISEREHQRIGQDLHDSIGQQLTGTMLLADTLQGKLTRKPEKADVQRLVSLLAQARMQTHQLARGLHPVPASAHGLMSALGQLAQSVSGFHGMDCRFHCPQPVLQPDNAAATHLFRVAQEAVNNAIRHGHCKRINLSLTAHKGAICLRVRDNGQGIRLPPPQKSGGGLGLQIMRSRCEAIGALFKIRPLRPRGTLVECLLPASPAAINQLKLL